MRAIAQEKAEKAAQLAKAESASEGLTKERDQLLEQVKDSKAREEAARKELYENAQKEEEKVASMHAAAADLEQAAATERAAAQFARSELADARLASSQKDARLEECAARLQRCESERDALRARVAEADAIAVAAAGRCDELERAARERDEAQQRMRQLEITLQEREAALDTQRERNRELLVQQASQQQSTAAEQATLLKRATEADQHLEEVQQELARRVEAAKEQEQQVSAARQQQDELHQRLQDTEAGLAARVEQCESLQRSLSAEKAAHVRDVAELKQAGTMEQQAVTARVEEYSAKVNELTAQLDEAVAKTAKQADEIATAAAEKAKFQEALDVATADGQRLSAELAQKTEEAAQQAEDNRRAKETQAQAVQALQAQLSQAQAQLQSLSDHGREETAELKARHGAIEADRDDLRRRLGEAEAAAAAAGQARRQFEADEQAAAVERDKVKAEADALQARVSELQESLAQSKHELEISSIAARDADQRLSTETQRQSASSAEVDDLTARLAKAGAESERLAAALAEAEHARGDADAALAKLKTKYAETESRLEQGEQREADHEKERERITADAAQLQQELEQLRLQLVTEQLREAEGKVSGALASEQKGQELRDYERKHGEELQLGMQERSELIQQLKDAEHKASDLDQELSDLRQEHEELSTKEKKRRTDLRKFKDFFKKSDQEIEEARKETAKAVQEKKDAEAALAKVESAAKEHAKRVDQCDQEQQAVQFVLRQMYGVCEPEFVDRATPRICVDLKRALQTTPKSASPLPLLRRVCEAVELLAKLHQSNPEMAFYWLTASWHMVHLVRDFYDDFEEVTGEDITYAVMPPEEASNSDMKRMFYSLRLGVHEMFRSCFTHCTKHLETCLVQAVLEQRAGAILSDPQQSPAPARACTPARGSGAAQRAVKRAEVVDVIHVLSEAFAHMQDVRVPDPLCLQFFCQLSYWINAQLFNCLLDKADLCTVSNGFQIKLGLSQLDEWFAKIPLLAPARAHLEHTKQAANLLVMDKALLLDTANFQLAFAALSPAQLAHLVHAFRPDTVSPEPVDPRILESMAQFRDRTGTHTNLKLAMDAEVLPAVVASPAQTGKPQPQ
eukprot:TRINITY_DN3386_c0_g1_i4.p1 TRINITY_DN3386_c0_g1~~TRINITY_DN3386_c0_g1_i4.p1  ORF type:complete len:1096 (+),score=389.13 TRINITY_DN3386_c0_g1_i4:2667-5954(+)